MNNIKNYTEAKKNLLKAESWVAMGGLTDSQSGSFYELKFKMASEGIQWMGQAYAGAKNYHSPEGTMVVAIEKAIKSLSVQIFDKAIKTLEADVAAKGKLAKADLESALAELS